MDRMSDGPILSSKMNDNKKNDGHGLNILRVSSLLEIIGKRIMAIG